MYLTRPPKGGARRESGGELEEALGLPRDESQHPQRTAGPIFNLEWRSKNHSACRRQLIKVTEALKPIAPISMQKVVRGHWWTEMDRLSRVSTNRLRAKAKNTPALYEPLDDGGVRPRGVGAIIPKVRVITPTLFGPIGPQQHPIAFWNASMTSLPGFNDRLSQQKIWIARRF